MDPEERFTSLVDEFAGLAGVTVPEQCSRRGFGSGALKVNGSIFAMLTGGRLVVKLPRTRVDSLVGSGMGGTFEAGKGRPMKEWLTVTVDDDLTWLSLAREALEFVGSRRPAPR
ncbi:TfoX/Sxy family protein [Rhodococcus oryzae]|uniref:TfoX/Sxy family protein n=1 Tax=Rhodococcus oryzae TaxID=2571143 RepID=A0ABY2RSB5_9NOCA|nr:TfoX/Sxy family protein [Rhodococcus oryzae]TJZ80409.1 TfoX/Sxy family protein [Rhodococcus oryzae]